MASSDTSPESKASRSHKKKSSKADQNAMVSKGSKHLVKKTKKHSNSDWSSESGSESDQKHHVRSKIQCADELNARVKTEQRGESENSITDNESDSSSSFSGSTSASESDLEINRSPRKGKRTKNYEKDDNENCFKKTKDTSRKEKKPDDDDNDDDDLDTLHRSTDTRHHEARQGHGRDKHNSRHVSNKHHHSGGSNGGEDFGSHNRSRERHGRHVGSSRHGHDRYRHSRHSPDRKRFREDKEYDRRPRRSHDERRDRRNDIDWKERREHGRNREMHVDRGTGRRDRDREQQGYKSQRDENQDTTTQAKKEEPNFALSGKLTEFTNTYKGVVIKYNEPPEARKPKTRWRLYPFKGDEALSVLHIHRQSAYLIGRERKIVDIPVDHPSCSKQHSVLQFRLVDHQRPDGMVGKKVKPYIIDLESTNGTYVNNKRIEERRYVELMEKDVLKFGFSTREYVILHEKSKDDEPDDDMEVPPDE